MDTSGESREIRFRVWSILTGWGFCLSNEENGYFRLSDMDISL